MSANDTAPLTVDWSTVATGWDTYRDSVEVAKQELTTRLLDWLDLKAGQRVLELGAGTGELARRMAAQVGPTGRVLASDVAPGMVALIEATTADLPQVHVAQLDAADIGHRDALFDAAAFRMGLMFLPDPVVALTELRRVIAPGGRLAVTTWAAADRNMWLVSVGMAAMINGVVAGPMPTEPGGPLSLTHPESLADHARAAGFTDVTVDAVSTPFAVADVDEHITHVTALAPPLAAAFGAATVEQRAAVRATVIDLVKQFEGPSGLVIPGEALLLRAR